jgi:hypothetical protein
VIYNPLTQKFEGNAWNYLIGQIPMHIHLGNTPTSGGSGGSGALSKGFVGKVKIIGPLGGRKAYKNDIYNPDKSYDSIGMTKAINAIRKNIGLLKRNSTNTINAI